MPCEPWTNPHLPLALRCSLKVLPSKLMVTGSRVVDSLFKQWNFASPVEPGAIEMAQYFWYLNCNKAARELSFKPRDASETLHDTVSYLRENFLGGDAFRK